MTTECTVPKISRLKTNKDLAFGYLRMTEAIELCVVSVSSLNRCIEDFNQNLNLPTSPK